MVLSNVIIKSQLGKNIIIYPFNENQLSNTSYDVTLGKNYYVEKKQNKNTIYNPFDIKSVENVWGKPKEARPSKNYYEKYGQEMFINILPDEEIILIHPKQTILCHTNEFIGGMNCITTMMKARSSYGRSFIEVCKCAGWGDVGYTNRWTMEVTNNSQHHIVPLVVGKKIAQIIFMYVGEIEKGTSYNETGKYQTSSDINKIIEEWTPETMLPKLYL